MKAEDVIELLDLLEQEGIGVVVDGGWGVDALLGRQTRAHDDLDIAIEHKDVVKLQRLLEPKGFREIPQLNSSDFNFLITNPVGQKVDLHCYVLDPRGQCTYGISCPAESLTGMGSIGSRVVKCISPAWVVKFHTRYEPDENEFRDVHAICARIGLTIPPKYIR
jgi:lincosamide nucleotidyltransferase A/C/D/E